MFLNTIILGYHRIVEGKSPKGSLTLSVEQFAQQMHYLHTHGYQCLTLSNLLQLPESRRRQSKSLALTFDDGYLNFITQAYPILQRYGFNATLFIVTDYVGQLSSWNREEHTLLLTREQIKTLYNDGVAFESHTCTHPMLTQLPTQQIWHELTASKAYLEVLLDQEVRFIAYPYGDINEEVQKMAKAAGYQAACGIGTGQNGLFNLWRWLPRTSDSLLTFAFKISPLYRCLHHLKKETHMGRTIGRLMHSPASDRSPLMSGGFPDDRHEPNI